MRWHACRSLSSTFVPVETRALHTFSRFWSENDPGTGLISIISLPTYCAALSAFFSNLITRLRRRLLQFFETCSSEWSSLYLPKKSSNRLLRCSSLSSIFSTCNICRLTHLLKDFQVGILLQPYYRINSITISKIKVRKKNGFSKCMPSLGGCHRRLKPPLHYHKTDATKACSCC